MMNFIISSNQSTFILGHLTLIIDNMMVAHELLLTLKKTKNGRVGKMVVKFDMSKAYDRVEWLYLEAVMKAMEFVEPWIKLVISCITTVNYLMLVNEKPGLSFVSSRELRQGDPLSSYFFLICVKGLSSLIKNSKRSGKIQGLAVKRGGTSISNLFFVDDIILLGKATKEECGRMKKELGPSDL